MATNPIRKLTEALTGTDVPTAEERAKAARQFTIEAGAAVEAAKAALSAADEAGNPGDIQKAEAALIAAERAADRATRGLEVAERRLQQVEEAATAAAREDGMRQLQTATQHHYKGAQAAQQAVDSLAAALAELDRADATIGALQHLGVASGNAVAGLTYGQAASRRRVELLLIKSGVLIGGVLHDPERLDTWSESLGKLLLSE